VHEKKYTGTEDTAASAVVNPASTASADDVDAPTGANNDNSDDQGPIRRLAVRIVVEITPMSLRLPRQ
jgi:hypothetical protein